MGLLSFLKREPASDAPAAKPLSPDEAQRVRTQARRRLIGAFVLLGIGIIAFPLVFETQPRPIPVDLPIDIPRKDAAAPLNPPPSRAPAARASGAVTAEAPRELASPSATPAPAEPVAPSARVASAPSAAPAPPAAPPAATTPATTQATPTPATTPPAVEPPRAVAQGRAASAPAASRSASAAAPAVVADATRAKALLEGAGPEAVAPGSGKFVVQVGAFSDAATARDMRERVEKLGLRTYTQVVDTKDGKRTRVRVGPFASRDEADKAAARIRSAGIGQQQVLTL